MINIYTTLLKKVQEYAKTRLSINVVNSVGLDSYYKGDMNGETIWTTDLDDEEELFNVLHMIGHCIQWGLDDEKMKLGSKLHSNPDPILLRRLQEYEWEANCYALSILHEIGAVDKAKWLYRNYQKDMLYLTHFYITGEKVKEITDIAMEHLFIKPLIPIHIPKDFKPKKIEGSRNGIVIDFKI